MLAPTMTEPSRIHAAEFEELVRTTTVRADQFPFSVVSLALGEAVLRLAFHDTQLRAGGTLNGPTMFTLADTALYAAVLTHIGMQPLAVTSDLSIRFLRKPEPKPLVARARLLRIGRRSAVGLVEIASEGDVQGALVEPLVAHASGTYAIP
jgi:uncharacterized protein (TIGR00369 family)